MLPWGELWLLIYAACGHDFYFFRKPMNYEPAKAEAEVRTYYATCDQCAADTRRKYGA